MEWISVEDRLPNKNNYVLAFVDSFVWVGKQIKILSPRGFANGKWIVADWDTGNYIHYNVTHWMPLPEPPKGEKDEKNE